MKKHFISFTFLLISITCFCQNTRCKDGLMIIDQNNDYYHLSIVGELLGSSNLNQLFSINNINDKVNVEIISADTLMLIHLENNTSATVSYKLIETKTTLSLCAEEYMEKLDLFFKDNLSEITFNSTKEIPILTFTRIQ